MPKTARADPSLASIFYGEREAIPRSINELIAAAKSRSVTTHLAKWFETPRLPGHPNVALKYYCRGHADQDWALTSTLYRAVQEKHLGETHHRVTEGELAATEHRVLQRMRAEGLGRKMSDGELLMVLQHHAIPTRLLDVSTNFGVALFFAAHELDTVDGRVFVVGVRPDQYDPYNLDLRKAGALPWADAAIGQKNAKGAWTTRVCVAGDIALDPRMRAQDGWFLVGGVARRYAGENLPIQNRLLTAAELPDVTSLRIMFPQRGARKPSSDRWPATGWTIRIPADWKPEIRHRLRDVGYTPDSMYPDFDGCRRLGAFVARS